MNPKHTETQHTHKGDSHPRQTIACAAQDVGIRNSHSPCSSMKWYSLHRKVRQFLKALSSHMPQEIHYLLFTPENRRPRLIQKLAQKCSAYHCSQ